MNDEKLMKRCIEIGQSVLGLTYPNPNVGSLLFCDGKIKLYPLLYAETKIIKRRIYL